MTKPLACHYSVVRFAPYPETDEFVNVGVVLACPALGYLDFKRADLRRGRVGRFFPELDGDVYAAAMHAWADSLKAFRHVPADGQTLTAPDEMLFVLQGPHGEEASHLRAFDQVRRDLDQDQIPHIAADAESAVLAFARRGV